MNRLKEIIKEARAAAQESSHDPKEYDFEGEMTKRDLETIAMHIQRIESLITDETNMPEWVQGKITLAKDYIQTVSDYLASELQKEGVDESSNIGWAKKRSMETDPVFRKKIKDAERKRMERKQLPLVKKK